MQKQRQQVPKDIASQNPQNRTFPTWWIKPSLTNLKICGDFPKNELTFT